MSPRRALVAGAVVAGALVTAALVSALRPDASAAVDAARVIESVVVTSPEFRPVRVEPERGTSAYVTRFSPEDHGGHRQSWAVAQAPSGLVYVANSDGVLEYDGVRWRLIAVPNFRVRAVAVGPNGVVHVGGEGTIGTLAPDSTGRMAYREIPSRIGDASVWAAVPTERGVLFQTFERLLAVEDGRVVDVKVAPEGRRFHKVFEAGGATYARLEGAGLLQYRDRQLVRVAGGDRLADTPVRALLDLDSRPGGALLVVTDDELFRLNPAAMKPFVAVPTAATETLRQTRAYHGCPVGPPDNPSLAITTVGSGVVIVSPAGEVIEHLSAEVGLTPDDLVLGCATDVQGGLWLSLSAGVVRVDAAAPLTTFDLRLGLDGAVSDAVRYRGDLYAATDRGVYRLQPSTDGESARFEPVQLAGGDLGQAWSLLATDAGLLVAGTGGLFVVEGRSARAVLSESAFSVSSSTSAAETVVYVGLRSSLVTLEVEDGRWEEVARAQGIDGEVWSVFPVEGGAWVAEGDGRLLRISARGQIVHAYGETDGVPEGLASVQLLNESLVVLAADGPYRIKTGADGVRFAPMHALRAVIEKVVGDIALGYGVRSDEAERVWISGRERTQVMTRSGGGWANVTPVALRRTAGVKGVLVESDVLWVSTTSGLLRLAGGGGGRYAAVVPAQVTAVEAGGPAAIEDHHVSLPYGSPVRFRVAAAAFNGETLYRTQLVGHDRASSAWSSETFRDYTNLSPGDYAFRVEGLTAQGTETQPATVAVHVPAPWYLTTWAAMLAALLSGTIVAGVASAASREQRRRADTEQARADELDRLNAELRHADEVKDSMLANTSHELRTPLTAILGFAEVLSDHEDDEVREFSGHMLSGARRLLHTVNDLLDIARLRSGKATLVPVATDVVAVARGVAAELGPLAADKGLALFVVPDGHRVSAVVDPEAFARIVTNLVSNAVKFSDAGAVTIHVDGRGTDVHLAVRDTGRGMEPEFLSRLFDTFEQESTGYARSEEGTGLGLAITSRLVALMGGRIEVESTPGVGSTFLVTLPVGASAKAVQGALPPASGDQGDGVQEAGVDVEVPYLILPGSKLPTSPEA